MVAFLFTLVEHVQSIFDFHRLKHGGRDVVPSLGDTLATLLGYLLLFCLLHAALVVYWQGQPLTAAALLAALYHAVHYSVFLVLYLLLGGLRLLGLPLPPPAFPAAFLGGQE